MRKKFLFGFLQGQSKIFLPLLLSAIVIIIAFFGLQSYKPMIKTFSNVTELYSLFTPYMKSIVFSYIQPVNCNPDEYYYNDSSVCFLCNGIVPCFGYGWVNRTGEMMNPKGELYLSGNYDLKSELNFYTFGIADLLDCECNGECICEDGIKANILRNTLHDTAIFSMPDNMNINEKIQSIAERMGKGNCEVLQNDVENGIEFECEELTVRVLNNTVVFRWEEKY